MLALEALPLSRSLAEAGKSLSTLTFGEEWRGGWLAWHGKRALASQPEEGPVESTPRPPEELDAVTSAPVLARPPPSWMCRSRAPSSAWSRTPPAQHGCARTPEGAWETRGWMPVSRHNPAPSRRHPSAGTEPQAPAFLRLLSVSVASWVRFSTAPAASSSFLACGARAQTQRAGVRHWPSLRHAQRGDESRRWRLCKRWTDHASRARKALSASPCRPVSCWVAAENLSAAAWRTAARVPGNRTVVNLLSQGAARET